MLKGHGGNLWEEAKRYRVDPSKITDFSSSINSSANSYAYRHWINDGMEKIRRYPDPEYNELREALSVIYGLRPATILPANGSTELLYMAPRALGCRNALIVSPSYADYGDACRMAKVKVKRFYLKAADDFTVDTEKLSRTAKDFDMVIIGNPNNPTGGAVERKRLLKMIDKNRRTMFVVDESFMDFSPEESLLKNMRKNLIVIRSLTKFYGIPGLRIGFAAAHSEKIKSLWSHKEPWTVNCLAESFVLKLAENGFDSGKVIENTQREIRYLHEKLSAIPGLKLFPAKANFLLVRIKPGKLDAPSLKAALLRKGMLIRDCSNFTGLDKSYFRVSARKRIDNAMLVNEIKKIMGK